MDFRSVITTRRFFVPLSASLMIGLTALLGSTGVTANPADDSSDADAPAELRDALQDAMQDSAPGNPNTGAPAARLDALTNMDFPALPAAPVTSVPAAPIAVAPPQRLSSDKLFPRYEALTPAVSFWKKVFGEYSTLQTVIHSTEYPHKVLRVLDFRTEAVSMSEVALYNYRKRAESQGREAMEKLIRGIEARRASPQSMSAEERRVFMMFSDVSGNPFPRIRESLRTQRGLRERTEEALRVSDSYIPYMEQIFSGYGLPKTLTRLPLVESSFNLAAYSKSGAAGIWQFIPSSAKIYMRLNEVVDDRRDPWTSTDAAARHLRDDYALLQDWPLALTAYNHGRNGIARGLKATGGKTIVDLIKHYDNPRFGFAGKNYYAEFLAAIDVERDWRNRKDTPAGHTPLNFEVVETKHYVPYDTLRRLCGASDAAFQRLNPAYRPEVINGKLFVPPGHLIRVPAGAARNFEVAYSRLGANERFDRQRVFYLLHKVRKGDTLGRIANEYRVSLNAVRAANDMKKSSFLRIGQVLKVPPHEESRPGPISVAVGESKPSQTLAQRVEERRESGQQSYTVRSGDTISSISRRYGVSQTALKLANDLSSAAIRVGQNLTIPSGADVVAVTAKSTSYRRHKVRSGQTLISIARSYNVSVNDLRSANGMGKSSAIKAGQTLKVPTT
jgi:membrane-bound lytic murein transglycosylase D